jgi:non-specific serine/threonine protein kinase/serine/threonine-protein kinase
MGTTSLALRSHQMLMRAMERDAADRRAFVREACANDAELLARVLKLLDAADRATSFLDTPALGTNPATPRIDLPTPDAVGSYLVTGVLGSGGMATVYEAIQEDPERRVALKVLHRTVEDNAAYQRFRFEAEALARLRHPHIAQIYEAGAAPLGDSSPSPFFAMELVEDALPITRFVAERGLSIRERLELFVSVCEAVHHGHQHGVIHRDIKPANVLVGADGVPKVIDFGIAMAAGGDGRAMTTGIDRGQLIGTLNAMSPEQCGGGGEHSSDIDTRADVYALGVLLYEMVADKPPHDLSAMSVPQAIRTIVETDAPKPSAHNPAARGDLDAIIGKAIRRDRRERYPGAASLAADVRRHLEHKPIEARPASLALVMKRFARRSPALAGAIGAAVLLLVGGVVVSSSLAIEANAARKDAEDREKSLERVVGYQESLLAGLDVAAIGDDMRAGLVEAVSVKSEDASAQLETAIGGVNFTTLALHAVDHAVLRPSHEAINAQFADDPGLRARLLLRLGVTMYALGLPASTEPVLRESLAIRREMLGDDHDDTLRSLNALGLSLNAMGRYEEAKAVMAEGYERSVRVLGRDDESTMRLGVSLGLVHRALGELDEAEAVWRVTYEDQERVLGAEHDETLRTMNNLAVLYGTRGELGKAADQFASLLELRRKQFGADSPQTISLASNLGIILRNKGDFERSGELLGEAYTIASRNLGDEHPMTLRVLHAQAESARLAGDADGAYELIGRVVDARTDALGEGHPDTLLARRLQAELVQDRGDARAGLDGIEQVIAGLATALSAGHPLTHETRLIRAQMLLLAGDADASLAECEATLAEARAGPRPNQGLLGRLLSGQGRALMALDRLDEAGPPLAEGAELLAAAQGAEHVYTRNAEVALAEFRARTGTPGPP